MKRVSTIRVKFDSHPRGMFAQAVVTTNAPGLTRDEARAQHDDAVDSTVSALRNLSYVPTAPLRSVTIR